MLTITCEAVHQTHLKFKVPFGGHSRYLVALSQLSLEEIVWLRQTEMSHNSALTLGLQLVVIQLIHWELRRVCSKVLSAMTRTKHPPWRLPRALKQYLRPHEELE